MIDELLALLAEHDPAYPSKILGASEQEILQLASLVRSDLPPVYVEFLKRMGRSMGDFQVPDTDFGIDTVLDFYEPDGWHPPPRYLFIAAHQEDAYLDYYLDLASGPEFSVVRFAEGEDLSNTRHLQLSFPSFRDLLFSFGFLFKRMADLPHQNLLFPSTLKRHSTGWTSEEAAGVIARLGSQMGFRRVPHVGPEFLLLDRADAAIYASNSQRVGMSFKVAARDKPELTRLCEIIRDHTVLE